jgi:hypothetical protein
MPAFQEASDRSPLMGRVFTNTGIDNQMNLVYPEINAFVTLPPLVVTLNENSKSTVQKRKAWPPDGSKR